jgi:hypothetical protein
MTNNSPTTMTSTLQDPTTEAAQAAQATTSTPPILCLLGCQQEDIEGAPGYWLDRWLEMAGGTRRGCLVALVSDPAAEVAIAAAAPHVILAMGQAALEWALGDGVPRKVGDWRGSLLPSRRFPGTLVVATHPVQHTFKRWEDSYLVRCDVARVVALSNGSLDGILQPEVRVRVADSAAQVAHWMDKMLECVEPVSFDIEGGLSGITSIAFSLIPASSFVIPFSDVDGEPLWDLEDEVMVWEAIQRFLESTTPKVLHNAAYDAGVLAAAYGIHVANIIGDTLLQAWCHQPEAPKDLATLASLHTLHPFWKDGRESQHLDVRHRYNALDAAVTLELAATLPSTPFYRSLISTIPVLHHATLRGAAVNLLEWKRARVAATAAVDAAQAALDAAAGAPVLVSSHQQLRKLLHTTWKLPRVKKTLPPTSDDALVAVHLKARDPRPLLVVAVRKAQDVLDKLESALGSDKRVRVATTPVGDADGSLKLHATLAGFDGREFPTSILNPDATDLHLHTLTLDQPELRIAAWWAERMGDDAMMLDLAANLSIPGMVQLLDECGPKLNLQPREELAAQVSNEFDQGLPAVVVRGCLLGWPAATMVRECILASVGLTNTPPTPQEVAALATSFRSRYWGVSEWQRKLMRHVEKEGQMTICGQRRSFLSRRPTSSGLDAETAQAAISYQYQMVMGEATRVLVRSLWGIRDEDDTTRLRWEPLLVATGSVVVQSRSSTIPTFPVTLTLAGKSFSLTFTSSPR